MIVSVSLADREELSESIKIIAIIPTTKLLEEFLIADFSMTKNLLLFARFSIIETPHYYIVYS